MHRQRHGHESHAPPPPPGPCAGALADAQSAIYGAFGLPPCPNATSNLGQVLPFPRRHVLAHTAPTSAGPILLLDAQHHAGAGTIGMPAVLPPPACSILMPAFRAAAALAENVPLLLAHTAPGCELLIVLDESTGRPSDPQREAVEAALNRSFARSALHRVRLYCSALAMWESGSEAFLIEQSRATSFFISVQPDQMIQEPGWNDVLAAPLRAFTDVFAVSARCAGWEKGLIGHCRSDVYTRWAPAELKLERRTFHVREAVNRGPMLLHAGRYRELGGYDLLNHLMDGGESDLHCRANRRGWVSGLYVLDFYSKEQFHSKWRPSAVKSTGDATRLGSIPEWRERRDALHKAVESCHRSWLGRLVSSWRDDVSSKSGSDGMTLVAPNPEECDVRWPWCVLAPNCSARGKCVRTYEERSMLSWSMRAP